MRHLHRHLGGILVLLVFLSCKKSPRVEATFGPETTITISVGQVDTVFLEQDILLKEMQERHQIYDLQCSEGIWSIHFKHGRKARFSETIFPFIQVGSNQQWAISGKPTGIAVTKDGNGNLQVPVLSVGEDGFFYLDESQTDFQAAAYQAFILNEKKESLNVTGFLVHDDDFYIYLSNDSVRKYSILKDDFYQVPKYWLKHLVNKETMAEEALLETRGNGAAFAFFTDAHWGYNFQHSPALIRHITEFTPITNVFFGGDVITNYYDDLESPFQLGLDFQASFSFLGPHLYCVYGNHDNNSTGQSNPALFLTDEQVGVYLQDQMTELDKKEGYNFYFDDPTTKTRYVGLDTGRYYLTSFRQSTIETARFMIDALSDVPEDWHVIFVSHIWAIHKRIDGVPTSVFNGYFNSFLNIIHDFNARNKGVFTFQKQSVNYDFSDSRALTECCIGGHTHLNSMMMSKDVLPVILIGKDSMKRNSYKSIENTTDEQCVVIFVVDYNLRKIKLFYIGPGEDQVIDLPQ